MKPVDVKSNTYNDSIKKINNKDPKFKIGDTVRISNNKIIFAKDYTPNWFKEIFVIKKVKHTVLQTYIINDLNGEEIVGAFYEKEVEKANQKELTIEKVVKRKGDKLYVKWKGYNNSLNSWIDKKDVI